MPGIYIHIPFCRKACHYCNFHFSTSLAQKAAFVNALLKEVDLMSGMNPDASDNTHQGWLFHDELVETIYFGGGTPSLLSAPELHSIVSKLHKRFIISPTAEITIEANPDDISLQKLEEWKSAGINRLSIGVQSFFDEDLLWMNRAHDAREAVTSIELAQKQGFLNITADLIYGTPLLTDKKWQANVRQLTGLGVPHLSCYALTVEPSTAMHALIKQKKMQDVDPEVQATQFLLLTDWLEEAGYEHYEISNFAVPGMRSRHNSAYWQGKNYLGFGPSAHSFNGSSRKWNISNNALYIQSLADNKLPFETEHLTPVQQLNEYIMISLRTAEGLDLKYVEKRFGEEASAQLGNAANKYLREGKISHIDGVLQLTRAGKLFADGIAADLFVEGMWMSGL
jgi:oxygen-independent coproporphyrinogen-3 oxidase